ncbi:hypothetical protein ACL2XK_10740 [Sodalis sp. RH23]|uniref:hypothetical protein n=1 Tax=unclassified Sodalis (in: enterobacteria) TaxID=2636512 RepID=UPI0039B49DD5
MIYDSLVPKSNDAPIQHSVSTNSDNNAFFSSLRDKLTGVANASQRPLPEGLLARIDNSRGGEDIDEALFNDIRAYLERVRNEYPDDATRPEAAAANDAGNKPAGSATSFSLGQKVLREASRIHGQIKSLDKEKLKHEADRILGQIGDEAARIDPQKIGHEFNRVAEQTKNETKRAVEKVRNFFK